MAYPLGSVVQNSTNWTETITATGTWTAPTVATNGFTITSMSIEVIGGGGSGGATSGVGGTTPGAGGGGGAYSKLNSFTVSSASYTATVGGVAGDSWFSTTGTVLAKGGATAATTTAGAGGAAGSGVGDTKFSGGAGGAGSGVTGGGGGGGAGSTGNGNPASTTTAGAAKTVGGGAGGASSAAGSVQGGGGGGAAALGSAGAGARGYIVLTYNKVYSANPTESVGAPTDSVTRSTTLIRAIQEGEGATSSTYASVVLADTPSLYWKLNENGAASSTYADSSGNGNVGQQWLGAAQSVPGAIINSSDTGIHQSGAPGNSSNAVAFASTYNPFVSGATRTYEMWLWRDHAPQTYFGTAFSSGRSADATTPYAIWGGNDFGASFNTRTLVFSPQGNSGGHIAAQWTNVLPLGPYGDGTGFWFHQVIVHNDSTHKAELFLNGVSQGQQSVSALLNTGDVFRLAHWFETNTLFGHFTGSFDEVAIYEYGLTAAQILNHYLAGIANQVTDSVSRQYTANRTLTESVTAPTDAVSRVFVGSRSMAESIAAPTDSVARATATSRTVAENIAIPTDAVTRQLSSTRTVSENIAIPTDSVGRIATFNRSLSENVAAPTDTPSRQTNLGRTVAENVDAPTDSVARHASFNRNPTEILPGEGGGTTTVIRPTIIFDD